jgi:hypothetical protein
LAFNATTGDAEPGPSIGSVTTVASQSANINTLAGIDSDITTVSGISSNVTTVAGISSNVTTVAGISSDVTAVAGDATDIGIVSTNIASVNTVATNIADVITVANDLNEAVSEVVTVADDLNEAVSEIDTVASSISNVDAVGTNISNVNTVAGISANVTTVAGVSANVTTVAGISSNVTTVAGISSDVTTVAADGTDIGTVATNIANVNTVGGISGNVTTVAGISANVTTVAGISSDVSTVAGDSTAINAVANDATDIGLVAGSIANVNNVGGSIANVNTVASNLASVNNFGEVYRISASAPTTSLDVGDLYFDTTSDTLKVYGASGWQNAGSSINGTSQRYHYDISGTPTSVTGADANGNTLAYDAGYVDVYVNGVRMSTADVTVTSGDTVTFTEALADGDEVDIVGYGTFSVASLNADNLDSGTVPDARITGAYTGITNLTMSGDLTVDTNTLYVDSANNRVGVGTVSPGRLLELYGTSVPAMRINNGSNIADIGLATSAGAFMTGSTNGALVLRRDGAFDINFGTNGQNRATIDSSGNLLVGTANSLAGINNTDEGVSLRTSGGSSSIAVSRDAGVSGYFNRNSVGDILSFRKDGSAVGSIGTNGTRFYLAGSGRGLAVDESAYSVLPVTTTGTNNDGGVGLGSGSARFSNLYLSGGVYLGGTGSANYLDDYEEGTFTPTVTFGGASTGIQYHPSRRNGFYTKVGNLVTYSIHIQLTNKGSSTGELLIEGLPFTSASNDQYIPSAVWIQAMASMNTFPVFRKRPADAVLDVYQLTNNTYAGITDSNCTNTTAFQISGKYYV